MKCGLIMCKHVRVKVVSSEPYGSRKQLVIHLSEISFEI
jgi:hypothetical protein